MIVAIDGPAGSGKSTIAKKVAEQLGFVYIDTGAMYRALTYGYLQAPIDFSKKEERIAFLERMKVGFNQKNEITLNDIVIKDEIRTFEVSEKVSYICSFPEIREAMTQLQRELAKKHSVIMDGRDIGTSVFPNADLKLFFVADSKERARRRQLDYLAKGIEKTVEEVEKEIVKRDELDSSRELSPLCKAKDAIEIDTTALSIYEVCEKIFLLVDERKGA
ncbi:(d)CMP kinase [Filifactor alocis]